MAGLLEAKPTNRARRTAVPLALLAFCFLPLLVLGGCTTIPDGKDAVTAVEIEGSPSEYDQELAEGLSTRASPKFLGIERGVFYEYETLDKDDLAQDLERIERQLRRRGYYEAKVTAARVVRPDPNKDEVRVEIRVDPGAPVKIRRVSTRGLASLPFEASAAATKALALGRGELFDEDALARAKADIARALADEGYAFVRVTAEARVNVTQHAADIDIVVDAGKRSRFGPIKVEGLNDLPEGPVREALQLEEGDRYSATELEVARSALYQLRAFSRVDLEPNFDDPESGVVPLTVHLRESALHTVKVGGGARLDVLRFAASAKLSWEHRNLFGGMRNFVVSTRPGVTFFPTRIDNVVWPTRMLPENALNARLQQPSFLEGRTTGFIDTSYNVYPLLYPLPEGADPRKEVILGYNEVRTAVGLERVVWGRHLPLELSYNWQMNVPFTYQGDKIDGLDTVIVSYPELVTTLDLRDNPISTKSGFYLSNSLQLANPLLFGKVSDVRIRPEARAFVPVDYAKRAVLAARVTLGFLFPKNYGKTLDPNSAEYVNLLSNPTDPNVVRDQEKLLFRAFYSGGPDSNRGYPFRRVGPQGPIGFLQPTGEDCSLGPGDPISDLPSACIRPLGGFTLWEASLELRFEVAQPWSVVAFMDASNVSQEIGRLNFLAPHVSIGPGLRYGSPIGPLRLDLGWRVPGLQIFETNPNTLDVAELDQFANDEWYEAFALNLLIGEAF